MRGQKPKTPRAVRSRSSTIRSSRRCASSKSSRAAGCSRIAGYLPFSSQAWKKNCQSMYSRSVARSGSTRRRPVNSGTGRSSNETRCRFSRACANGSSGLRSFSAWRSRSRSWSARFSASSRTRRSGSSRSETTPTTREASRTWTTGCEYAGAIRTAVCWRDVVAPPISSGRSIPRRSISRATSTMWSSDGVISPESPTTSTFSSTATSRIRSAGTITPRSITS